MIAEAAYGRGKDDVYRDMATAMHTGSLCGDVMLEAAARLQKQEHRRACSRNAGLTAKQAERFFALDESELERSLMWLEQPGSLLTANHPLYPPLLRTIPDYPGHYS
jgi:DNA processing protein